MTIASHFRVKNGKNVWVEPRLHPNGALRVELTVGEGWHGTGFEVLDDEAARDLIRRLEMALNGQYPVPLHRRAPPSTPL